MRGVKVEDINGNVVMRFACLADAAYYYGVSIASIRDGIKRKSMRGGNYILYDDEEKLENVKTAMSVGNEGLDLDNLTPRQFKAEEKRLLGLGVKAECLDYELRLGVVNVTLCRKKESHTSEQPKIGGIGCVTCRYFRGRCREEKKVLCVHRHLKTGGAYGCMGKNGGRKKAD